MLPSLIPSPRLLLDDYGIFVGRHSERLVIRKSPGPGQKAVVIQEVPFFRLQEVIVAGDGVTISADVVTALCERGIRLCFCDFRGQPVALLSSPHLSATVETRRAQFAAFDDARGLRFALEIARRKMLNQAAVLKYFGKYLRRVQTKDQKEIPFAEPDAEASQCAENDPGSASGCNNDTMSDATAISASHITNASPASSGSVNSVVEISSLADGIAQLADRVKKVKGAKVSDARDVVMGLEGAAASFYWKGVKAMLAGRVEFPGRRQRGTDDPVNMCFNYGYGMLYANVWGAVVLAGLEPFAGFLHVDRPGKPSLVLDLVEEFRAPVVDRAVISTLNRGFRIELEGGAGSDASPSNAGSRLARATRRTIADAVSRQLDADVTFEGKRHQLSSVIQMQARHLATYLRGERASYRAYAMKW